MFVVVFSTVGTQGTRRSIVLLLKETPKDFIDTSLRTLPSCPEGNCWEELQGSRKVAQESETAQW